MQASSTGGSKGRKVLTRIRRMNWHPISFAPEFRPLDQVLTLDQAAESCRTRRVKAGIGSLTSFSAAFGPARPVYLGNPGSKWPDLQNDTWASLYVLCEDSGEK